MGSYHLHKHLLPAEPLALLLIRQPDIYPSPAVILSPVDLLPYLDPAPQLDPC